MRAKKPVSKQSPKDSAGVKLKVKTISGVPVWYRPGTSDERVIEEVIEKRAYRKANSNFDVEAGETWLDLGANIGAFAVYCQTRRAKVVCYEPDPENFRVLKLNAAAFALELHEAAVTASRATHIDLYFSDTPQQQRTATSREPIVPKSRSSIFPNSRLAQMCKVVNVCGVALSLREFDGVKMDIEGAEGALLDHWYIPQCKKIILEYHTSKDQSILNLRKRLNYLRMHFVHVHYPPEFDRMLEENASGGTFRAFFDRLIYAWEPRHV